MVKVAPPSRRSTTQESSGGLEVMVPAKRNIFLMLFLTAWLVGWLMGEIAAGRDLFLGSQGGPKGFLVFWLVCWTVGGGFAIYVWSWMLAGKERIVLRADALSVRRELFGLGRTNEYDFAHVSNLRVAPVISDPWSSGMRFWGAGSGLVAFDYGAKTFRFGGALDEAEAAQIVKELATRHAFRGTV